MYLTKFVLIACLFHFLFFTGNVHAAVAQPVDYWEQGLKAYEAQNYQGAIEAWFKALEQGEASGRFKGQGVLSKIKLLQYIGGSYFQLGLNGQALSAYRHALEFAEQLGDQPAMVDLLVNIGRSYEYLGHFEESLASLTRAQHLVETIGGHPSEGLILNGLGQVHSDLAHYEQALASFTRTLQFARNNGIHWLEGSALLHIGMLHLNRGIFEKAIEHLQSAYDIAYSLKDTRGQSATTNSLGNFYHSLGQYGEALKYHHQSLAIKQRLQDKYGQGIAHLNIGNAHKHLGRPQQAIQAYELSLRICREIHDKKGEAFALNSLGTILLAENKYDTALARFRQSLTIGEEIQSLDIQCLTTMNIGDSLHGMGKTTEAYQTIGKSLDVCTLAGSPEQLWMVHRGLGTIEAQTQQYDKASVNYEKAINYIETMREGFSESHDKITFMQDKLMVYDQLVELYRQLHQKFPNKGYDKKALEIFERKQGRAFLEDMGRSGARHFAGLPDDVRRKETDLPILLAKTQTRLNDALNRPHKEQDIAFIQRLHDKIASLQAEKKTLEVAIRENYADYYALKYPQPASVRQIQQEVLNRDEMMLIYGIMDQNTCLWIIGKDHFSLHSIDVAEAVLRSEIQAFLGEMHKVEDAIGNSSSSSRIRRVVSTSLRRIKPTGRHIFELLFPQKVRELIEGAKTLYVVPTKHLYALPFEALALPKVASDTNARYLIQDHAVVYLSSASLLKTLRDAQSRRKAAAKYPLLAFANPVYDNGGANTHAGKKASVERLRSIAYRDLMGGRFAELPETEAEVKLIKKILDPPEESVPLQLRREAARSNVLRLHANGRLDDYRYIVFSCHGILPGEIDRVTQPALVLSLPDPQTGTEDYLTMADVFQFKLNAQFVTLSACNTGRGLSVKGEGVVGLTRAFMYAGTPSISVTLWSVESDSASVLSTGFYSNLKAGKSKAEALRQIKLKMIQGRDSNLYRHPFFWSPTVIFGDGQ